MEKTQSFLIKITQVPLSYGINYLILLLKKIKISFQIMA